MRRPQLLIIPAISSLFLTTGIFQSDSEAQVREVQSILLNDVGVARLDRQGNPYITINPVRCRQLGPKLCEFFRQHEYGHVHLKHLERQINPRQAEVEADCYAAKNVSPDVARAASDWFNSGNGASRIHGTSQQRANRVKTCSQTRKPTKAPNHTPTRKPVITPRNPTGPTHPPIRQRGQWFLRESTQISANPVLPPSIAHKARPNRAQPIPIKTNRTSVKRTLYVRNGNVIHPMAYSQNQPNR